jgi:hypothetical protein
MTVRAPVPLNELRDLVERIKDTVKLNGMEVEEIVLAGFNVSNWVFDMPEVEGKRPTWHFIQASDSRIDRNHRVKAAIPFNHVEIKSEGDHLVQIADSGGDGRHETISAEGEIKISDRIGVIVQDSGITTERRSVAWNEAIPNGRIRAGDDQGFRQAKPGHDEVDPQVIRIGDPAHRSWRVEQDLEGSPDLRSSVFLGDRGVEFQKFRQTERDHAVRSDLRAETPSTIEVQSIGRRNFSVIEETPVSVGMKQMEAQPWRSIQIADDPGESAKPGIEIKPEGTDSHRATRVVRPKVNRHQPSIRTVDPVKSDSVNAELKGDPQSGQGSRVERRGSGGLHLSTSVSRPVHDVDDGAAEPDIKNRLESTDSRGANGVTMLNVGQHRPSIRIDDSMRSDGVNAELRIDPQSGRESRVEGQESEGLRLSSTVPRPIHEVDNGTVVDRIEIETGVVKAAQFESPIRIGGFERVDEEHPFMRDEGSSDLHPATSSIEDQPSGKRTSMIGGTLVSVEMKQMEVQPRRSIQIADNPGESTEPGIENRPKSADSRGVNRGTRPSVDQHQRPVRIDDPMMSVEPQNGQGSRVEGRESGGPLLSTPVSQSVHDVDGGAVVDHIEFEAMETDIGNRPEGVDSRRTSGITKLDIGQHQRPIRIDSPMRLNDMNAELRVDPQDGLESRVQSLRSTYEAVSPEPSAFPLSMHQTPQRDDGGGYLRGNETTTDVPPKSQVSGLSSVSETLDRTEVEIEVIRIDEPRPPIHPDEPTPHRPSTGGIPTVETSSELTLIGRGDQPQRFIQVIRDHGEMVDWNSEIDIRTEDVNPRETNSTAKLETYRVKQGEESSKLTSDGSSPTYLRGRDVNEVHTPIPYQAVDSELPTTDVTFGIEEALEIRIKFDDRGEMLEIRSPDEGITARIAEEWQSPVSAAYHPIDMRDTERMADELAARISNEVDKLEGRTSSSDRRIITVSSIKVSLRPEHLGRIEIKVIKRGEKISAIIKAEDDSVRRLLHQVVPQIKQSLTEHGIRAAQVEVRSFNSSGGFGFANGWSGWDGDQNAFHQPRPVYDQPAMGGGNGSPAELDGENDEGQGVNLRI